MNKLVLLPICPETSEPPPSVREAHDALDRIENATCRRELPNMDDVYAIRAVLFSIREAA